MVRELDISMFWNIRNTLTYNALFNYIIGNRGGGKTFGALEFCISDYIKKQNEFVYIRRYKDELQKVIKNNKLFRPLIEEECFGEHKIDTVGDVFTYDEKIMGYAIPLSVAKNYRSMSFPKVKTIIFDEFIIHKGNTHYLKDEVICFLELYETIARLRDVRVFFISNAITTVNPYFMYFNIRLPKNKNILYENEILIELVNNESFIEFKKQTRFGKMINGTAYGDYAIENKFLRDSDTFLMKKTGNSKYYFTFLYKGLTYGVWIDYTTGKWFVSDDIDEFCPIVYSLSMEDHTPNLTLIKNLNKSLFFRNFLNAYKDGVVYFENVKLKNMVYEVIQASSF